VKPIWLHKHLHQIKTLIVRDLQVSLAFEHPIPLIPNAKIRYVNLKSQTENEVAGQPVYDLNIDHTDFILYYEILDTS
jgi:hypothetical protein